ncbi:unnamed protein product [Trichobilharzia szidati]|nr:unnamed protein product [Trichobilharzia szidati]
MECEQVAPLRQSQERFRSPDISRRTLGEEAVAAHTVKKSRRAKSTEPTALDPDDPFVKYTNKGDGFNETPQEETVDKRWSLIAKNYENMSKQELLSNYRLLMNEKLRLERFLSIMTKNNEMARNRLESDLLDAMMCIEDLKQALEIRMARRRKIDPREAEERRYLIRQNKKLLNQLFESAKKIERLEVTKVEMKEQLELLDFQIVEVENQKAMMEEELRKIPPTVHEETQTEENSSDNHQLISQLKEQLSLLRSDLSNQKAETAAAQAKQSHLDNLVRELRRDNIELRDQLARADDAENSLAESDKPMAADVRLLKSQLEEQLERVRELEEKLNSSRQYSEKLECRVQDLINHSNCQPSSESLSFENLEENTSDSLYTMTSSAPKSLLDERDQEIGQLKNSSTGGEDVNLPKLCESSIQTELNNEQMNKLSTLKETLNSGGHILTNQEYETLNNELKQTLVTLASNPDNTDKSTTEGQLNQDNNNTSDDLLLTANKLRKLSQGMKVKSTLPETKPSNNDATETQNTVTEEQKVIEDLRGQVDSLKQEIKRLQRGTSTVEERNVSGNVGEFHLSHSSPSHFYSMDPSDSIEKLSKDKSNGSYNPSYYSTQLQELRQTGDLELVRAHLSLSERRRRELERRITELTDELARSRAEARSAETSLSAARRTEAALRRRLLVAMDSRNSPSGNYEMNALHGSREITTSGSSEMLNIVELQADIIKLQATNASLNEAALLDRTRLHDQAMRIDQLESEHKALLDRISCLQAAETGAQRGIVRLQALYEDMLREYSESKPFELTNSRGRDRQRSQSRNAADNDNNNNSHVRKTSRGYDVRQLERQISDLKAVNASLKQTISDNSMQLSNATSTTIPVGTCNSPACIAVRNLLKALQNRYNDLMNQYIQMQQCTTNGQAIEMNTNTNNDNDSIILRKSSRTPAFIEELYNQLTNISILLSENNYNNKQDIRNYELGENINMCLRLIGLLNNWIKSCLTQNDMEIAHLRSVIMNLRMCSGTNVDQKTAVFTSSVANPISSDDYEQNKQQTFSCSISLTRKEDPRNCLSYSFDFVDPNSVVWFFSQ